MQNSEHTHLPNLSNVRHDINNQLSNIYMCVEALKAEIPQTDEVKFYIKAMDDSCRKIEEILKGAC